MVGRGDQTPVMPGSLAERLRALREREYRRLTQKEVAGALEVAPSTVSSWEKTGSDAVPSADRLAAYARLFCTSQSFASGNVGLLPDEKLTEQERQKQTELRDQLLALRDLAQSPDQMQSAKAAAPASERMSIWRFPDGAAITVVCSDAPEDDRPPYAKPDHLNYTALARYADLDTLNLVYGQIKADNPKSDVQIMPIEEFEADDTERHVVIIGGKAADDPAVNLLCSKLLLPEAEEMKYKSERKTWDSHIFRFGTEKHVFDASFDKDALVRDVGVFARGEHPIGQGLTVTVCNGITSRGVYGSALCFMDSRRSPNDSERKVRNELYVKEQLGGASTYCIFMNIQILKGKAVPPDLSRPGETWCFPAPARDENSP